jgi:Tfp pilus assembly protein PilP
LYSKESDGNEETVSLLEAKCGRAENSNHLTSRSKNMVLSGLKKNGWVGLLLLPACLFVMMPVQAHAAEDQTQAQEPPSAASEIQAAEQNAAEPPNTSANQRLAVEAQRAPAPQTETLEVAAKRSKVIAALLKKDFSYSPENMIDPFMSFIVQQAAPTEATTRAEEEESAPTPKMPLTPLQKMAVGQIERGFKAVLWGEMGMRALIEDDAGRGYIVGVGTPLGGSNGMVTDIQNDRLVIQQESWDPSLKQMVPHSIEIRLTKAGEKR